MMFGFASCATAADAKPKASNKGVKKARIAESQQSAPASSTPGT